MWRFYLMLALRTFLRDQGWFDERGIAIPNLAELLDLVALGDSGRTSCRWTLIIAF